MLFVILSLNMYSGMNCCSTGIVGSSFQCPLDTSLKHMFSCLAWLHLCLSLTPSRLEWSLLACTVHLQRRRKEWKPKDVLRTRAIFCSCSWRIKSHAHKAQQITNRLFFRLQFMLPCTNEILAMPNFLSVHITEPKLLHSNLEMWKHNF